jgi:hypothetical protein
VRKVVLAVMAVTVLVALWERWGQVVRQGPPEPPEFRNPDPLGLPDHLAAWASRDRPEVPDHRAAWVIRGPLDPQELRVLREYLDPLAHREASASRDQPGQPGHRDRQPPDSSAPPGSALTN